ncbi:MAG TPA: 3,4-dihydroxy-2-butanone-4-phosphate synthase, partial [Blastococcus sp.]
MTSPLARLDSIETAIAAIKDGRPVVVIDDEDRENEGDLIFASELATPDLVAFMVRYTSGYICVAVTESDADRLDLPPMFRVNQDRRGTAYTVTVDAREGVTTGISASDRAHTIRLLADATTTSADLARPGHIVPLRAKDGGVLRRPGHTEAAVDLAVLAGLRPSGTLCEVVSEKDPTGMARGEELRVFADEHDLVMVSIADLIAYRKRFDKLVERVAEARVPLRARPGGVLVRPGHTEAGVDLARLAGLRPAAAIVEIAREDGTMARLPELVPFARKHGLAIISIEDLIAYRRSSEPTVRREAETTLPTAFGDFRAFGYRSIADGVEHIALVAGDI